MITVDNIMAAQAVPNAVKIQKVADGYLVYQVGDELPQEPQDDSNVTAVVTPRQIRLALTASGLRSTVEQAVAAGSQDLKDWWEYALEIERGHPLVEAIAQQLGITEQQLDDLFRLAATL